LIWEAKVGPGKLLVCTSDLPALQDKPEARQLLACLQNYIASPQFNPACSLTPEELQRVFAGKAAKAAERSRADE
jgi:hypothetical protein